MKTSWQGATATVAFAAAQVARCGWDVSVQYGANQPEHDLVAGRMKFHIVIESRSS